MCFSIFLCFFFFHFFRIICMQIRFFQCLFYWLYVYLVAYTVFCALACVYFIIFEYFFFLYLFLCLLWFVCQLFSFLFFYLFMYVSCCLCCFLCSSLCLFCYFWIFGCSKILKEIFPILSKFIWYIGVIIRACGGLSGYLSSKN
jgi:hypothetical protein